MTEPGRLIDQSTSEFERTLLFAGIQHPSDPLRRTKVLAALGVGAVAVVTTKSAAAAILTWKKALTGVAMAATGVGGVVTYNAVVAPPSAPEVVTVEQVPTTPAKQRMQPRPAVEEVAAEPEVVEEVEILEPDVAPTPTRRQLRGKRVDKAPSEQPAAIRQAADIQAEVAYLDDARAALRAGRPSTTLRRLSEYPAKFPQRNMGLEAEVLRIEALAASGRSTEASRRASRLLERSPNSVVAARLRRYAQD